MNEILSYRVDSELKNEYNKFITAKYGQKLGTVGKNVEKAMKLYLTVNGNTKYQDDPDVIALMNAKNNIKSKSKDNTLEERLERKLEEKLEEKFAQFEKKARRESSKKHGHAEFKKTV